MKKFLAMLLILAMLIPAVALGEGMGVQLISGPQTETEPVSLDDVKLNVEVDIEGFGTICPLLFFYDDYFVIQGGKDYKAGNEADFALFYMDILNTTTKDKEYQKDASVKVIYDDQYEYGGWVYQIDYDYNGGKTWSDSNHPNYTGKQNQLYGSKTENEFAIKPMYLGHYVFGCTLPNAVINSKKPLRMVITIEANEITYNIRK